MILIQESTKALENGIVKQLILIYNENNEKNGS
jgi:hypothetical protein